MMTVPRQARHTPLIAIVLCMCGTLTYVKQKIPEPTRLYLPNLRFYNATESFSRSYYMELHELGILGQDEAVYVDVTKPLPKATFISAISSNHFYEGQEMAVALATRFPDLRIIIYDLGLLDEHKLWFQNACNVQVRNVNMSMYGMQNLLTYRWKPILIAIALKEFPVVFYVDTSTDVRAKISMDNFLLHIPMKPEEPNIYTICQTDHSAYAATNPGMYNYLPPQHDIMNTTMLEAGKVIYIRTKTTYELGLKWYVLCAFEEECMAPPKSKMRCTWQHRYKTYADCHRYDQSALNLIMGGYPNFNQSFWGMKFFWTNYKPYSAGFSKPICNSTFD